jgi:hypothetical protein
MWTDHLGILSEIKAEKQHEECTSVCGKENKNTNVETFQRLCGLLSGRIIRACDW